MTSPRRRAAARPAGPPDVQQSAPDATPAPSVTGDAGESPAIDARHRAVDGAHRAVEDSAGHPAAVAGPPQHRRRQRAPRGAAGRTETSTGPSSEPAGMDAQPPSSAGPAAAAAPQRPVAAPDHDDRRRGDHRGEHRADDRRRGESANERSLRALVSTRTTQLPFDVAMRAREVAQPSAQDLADAERELVIVRRHYVPPAPLATKKTDATRAQEPARGDGRRGGRRSGRG